MKSIEFFSEVQVSDNNKGPNRVSLRDSPPTTFFLNRNYRRDRELQVKERIWRVERMRALELERPSRQYSRVNG